jgi:adenine phosphoribosyltransferase
MDYKKYIREMAQKNRCDLTQLMSNSEVFNNAVKDLANPFLSSGVNKVVAVDAMGFAFGAGVALELNAGLVLARKAEKIAWTTKTTSFHDYSGERKELEIADDAIKPNEKILIVDDWAETGAQLKAAIFLAEELGGNVVGISCVNMDNPVRNDITLSKYNLHSIIDY